MFFVIWRIGTIWMATTNKYPNTNKNKFLSIIALLRSTIAVQHRVFLGFYLHHDTNRIGKLVEKTDEIEDQFALFSSTEPNYFLRNEMKFCLFAKSFHQHEIKAYRWPSESCPISPAKVLRSDRLFFLSQYFNRKV